MKRLFVLSTMLLVITAALSFRYAPSFEGRPLEAQLSGANEVPSGDPDGSGWARLTLNQGQGTIDFEVYVENIGTIVGGHIHAAPAGSNGGVVVNLGLQNSLVGSVEVDPELIKAIRQNPENYYVNVHTTEFPGGAVRGQLTK